MKTSIYRLVTIATLSSALALGACSDDSETAMADEPVDTPVATAGTSSISETPAYEPCMTCGTIQSITEVRVDGQSSGLGALAGAVIGGVAGNQVGGGSGKKIATVAGVVGGAVAGDTIEKNRNSEVYYEVVVSLEQGGQEVITVPDASGLTVGSIVSVENGNIILI